jgi:uncharacterized protein (TIGR03663 family)
VTLLDRPVFGRLTVEGAAHAAILLAALALRLFALGDRPLHHDESIHAYYAWRILQYGPADYRYDPTYHGPTLYYGTALVLGLFGASDVSARILPVSCSVGLAALGWPLRRILGRREALAWALLVSFSPTFGYYGRSLRHDVPMAFLTVAGVVAFLLYREEPKRHRLYLSALAFGLAAATKEDIYLTAFCFANALWIVPLWSGRSGSSLRERVRDWIGDGMDLARRSAFPLATAAAIATVAALVLYTSLLGHPENWNFPARAISHWWEQHRIRRIGGPWWYYLPLEIVYEPVILLGAILGLVSALRRAPVSRLEAFLATWAVLSFGVYAWAQEKVPWLLVPFLAPQALLAATWFGRLSARRVAAWTPLVAIGLWGLVASNYLYDAPRPEEPPEAAHAEPMVYVQSTYDIRKVVAEIRRVERILGTGRRTPLVVVGEATWPLSWYLRDRPVHWGSLPAETDAPVLIVDAKDAERLRADLGDAYREQRFAVRGWWQIDWSRLSLANAARFLLWRLAWNPPGTTDAVMFVAQDLRVSRRREPLRLEPAVPIRRYPGPPEQTSPARVLGRPGTGPGELAEPRGLAFDREGRLLVADSGNHRIQKLDPETGRCLAVFGGPAPGEEAGRFRAPAGVAAGPDGAIYVADTWNHRIQKLSSDGEALAEWRVEHPSFWGPRALVLADDGTLFVADTGNKRILAFDRDGRIRFAFGGEGREEGQFVEPVGLAIDRARGLLYVADTANRRIQAFSLDGRFRGAFPVYGWEEFYTEPYLAWASPSGLAATDSFQRRVNVYSPQGRLLRSIGAPAAARPIGIAVSPSGELFVSDAANHRILVYPGPQRRR